MSNQLHPRIIKKMISYYYLVAFCPPEQIEALDQASLKLRTRLAKEAGVPVEELSALVAPEVARRMVAFQGATRKPEKDAVEALTQRMMQAERGPLEASQYQEVLGQIAAHPGRAKAANRLHRQKGCSHCQAPCRFGFFTLMSDPDFDTLKTMLEVENQKNPRERNVVLLLWAFTQSQIWNLLETQDGMISADDLGNLAYCLLVMGTAKSRFAKLEEHLKTFQEMNSRTVQSLPSPVIRLYDSE